jgi:hypothetical protein
MALCPDKLLSIDADGNLASNQAITTGLAQRSIHLDERRKANRIDMIASQLTLLRQTEPKG